MANISDPFGQGVTWLDYTEAPDLKAMGDGLALALTGRCIMRFTSASQRDATLVAPLAAPVPGMMAYLASEDLYTVRTASGWQVLAAGSQAWVQPALASGFTHNGNANGNFRYRRVNLFGEVAVFLEGAVGVTYSPGIPNSGVLTASALPPEYRPSTLRTVTIPCSDTTSDRITLKLDARTNGQLAIYGTNSTNNRPPWIGFNGVFYTL